MRINFLEKTFTKKEKGIVIKSIVNLTRLLVNLARLIARSRLLQPLMIMYVARSIVKINSTQNGSIKILVLNEGRYKQDLDALGKHPTVELFSLPPVIQSLINSLWLSPISGKVTSKEFHLNQTPLVRECRQKLAEYLSDFLVKLQVKIGFNCVMSCTFYYKQDLDWIRACCIANVPFITLHKECLVDPVTEKATIALWQENNMYFNGHALIVHNELAKNALVKAEIFPTKGVHVTGILRMDPFYHSLKSKVTPRKQVTLFSFHHRIGLLKLKDPKGQFSNISDDGFYHYFDLVHGAVGRFAQENPGVDVWIKPKWMGSWEMRIFQALSKAGLDIEKIPNLHVSVEKDAHTLIQESSVVLGINSTTLLEAKLMKRPVIVPLFAEASDKYFDNHVYFQKYLEDVFCIERSPEDMINAITRTLESKEESESLPSQMIKDYLGYLDGRVSDRVVEIIKSEIDKVQADR